MRSYTYVPTKSNTAHGAKHTLRVLALGCAIFAGGCGTDEPAPGSPGDGQFENIVTEIRTNNNLPALGAMVIEGDNILELATNGFRSIEKNIAVTDQDHWQLGSISKAVTATLAARLVETSIINWSTPVDTVFTDNISRDYDRVSLRDLLHHRSGLTRDYGTTAYQEARTDRRGYTYDALNNDAEFNYGELHYSNTGYVVAGEMLAISAGDSWESLIESHVYAPLSITDYGFGTPATTQEPDQPIGHLYRKFEGDDRANGYWVTDTVPSIEEALWNLMGPAISIHMPMQEFSKFLSAHLSGLRGDSTFLSEASFNELHTPAPKEKSSEDDYAMGWEVLDNEMLDDLNIPRGTRVLHHNGTVANWLAVALLFPEDNKAVFVASNSGGGIASFSLYSSLLNPILLRHGLAEK